MTELPFRFPDPGLDPESVAAEVRAGHDREELLETVVEYLRLLVESTNEGIVGVDREGRSTFANAAAQRLLGYDAGELVGKPFLEVVNEEGGVVRRADGSPFPGEYTTKPIVVGGDVQGAVVVFSEAASARRAERYLETQRAVTEALADSATAEEAIPRILEALVETTGWAELGTYWSVDEEGRLACSARWIRPESVDEFRDFLELSDSLRLRSGVGLAGRAYERREPTWVSIEEALADRSTFGRAATAAGLGLRCAVAFPILAGGDVLAVIELFGRELSGPDEELMKMLHALGAPIGHFLERKRAEAEADRLKDEFISLVSHELRTPLSSVLGYLELLEREDVGPLTADQRRCLATIGRNANRLLRLVGDLLLVAQLEAGDVPLEPEPVSLAALGAEALENARPRASTKGIDLRLEISGEPIVHGDRERLGHVLDNLLSNAIKFTDQQGCVAVRVAAEPGGAVIEVADTGVGIPAAECEQLFTPFFRTESARVLAVQGSGLGLAISKALVAAHGGSISCRSAEGVGTTFRVELPPSRRRAGLALAGVPQEVDEHVG